MTTTPMTRYYMAVGDALGSAYVQSIESDEGGWVLYADVVSELVRLSARAEVLRAAMEKIVKSVPATTNGGCFYERYDGDGEYIGDEQVDPLSVIGGMAAAATDALEKETGHAG